MKLHLTVELDSGEIVPVANVCGTPDQCIPIMIQMLEAAGVPRSELRDIIDDETLPDKITLALGE